MGNQPGAVGSDSELAYSNEPALNGYGQNGYQGPSSDTPGKRTTSGFLPQTSLATGKAANDWQTRKVSAEGYPAHPGMKTPERPITAVPTLHRTRNIKK